MKLAKLASVVFGAMLLVGCAGGDREEPGGETDADDRGGISHDHDSETHDHPGAATVDVSVLRTVVYDYAVRSLEDLASEESVVAVGTVRGFEEGHTVRTWNSDLGYYDVRERNAVMKVKVDRTFKGEEYLFDGHIYVTLSRGVEAITEAGVPDRPAGAASTTVPVAEFGQAIPNGTRIVVMVGPASFEQARGEQWIDLHNGHPDGAALMWTHPQGLIFEDHASGTIVGGRGAVAHGHPGWQGLDDFNDLEKRLEVLAR